MCDEGKKCKAYRTSPEVQHCVLYVQRRTVRTELYGKAYTAAQSQKVKFSFVGNEVVEKKQ